MLDVLERPSRSDTKTKLYHQGTRRKMLHAVETDLGAVETSREFLEETHIIPTRGNKRFVRTSGIASLLKRDHLGK